MAQYLFERFDIFLFRLLYYSAESTGSSPVQRPAMEGCLRRYYAKHNPGNMENVAEIARRFRGRELELCEKLRIKYGCAPALALQTPDSVTFRNTDISLRLLNLCGQVSIGFSGPKQNHSSYRSPSLINAITGAFSAGPLSFLYSCLQERKQLRGLSMENNASLIPPPPPSPPPLPPSSPCLATNVVNETEKKKALLVYQSYQPSASEEDDDDDERDEDEDIEDEQIDFIEGDNEGKWQIRNQQPNMMKASESVDAGGAQSKLVASQSHSEGAKFAEYEEEDEDVSAHAQSDEDLDSLPPNDNENSLIMTTKPRNDHHLQNYPGAHQFSKKDTIGGNISSVANDKVTDMSQCREISSPSIEGKGVSRGNKSSNRRSTNVRRECEVCHECRGGRRAMICAVCKCMYHSSCYRKNISKSVHITPDKQWYCPECDPGTTGQVENEDYRAIEYGLNTTPRVSRLNDPSGSGSHIKINMKEGAAGNRGAANTANSNSDPGIVTQLEDRVKWVTEVALHGGKRTNWMILEQTNDILAILVPVLATLKGKSSQHVGVTDLPTQSPVSINTLSERPDLGKSLSECTEKDQSVLPLMKWMHEELTALKHVTQKLQMAGIQYEIDMIREIRMIPSSLDGKSGLFSGSNGSKNTNGRHGSSAGGGSGSFRGASGTGGGAGGGSKVKNGASRLYSSKQIQKLEEWYQKSSRPEASEIQAMYRIINSAEYADRELQPDGISVKQIRIWFDNRRAKERLDYMRLKMKDISTADMDAESVKKMKAAYIDEAKEVLEARVSRLRENGKSATQIVDEADLLLIASGEQPLTAKPPRSSQISAKASANQNSSLGGGHKSSIVEQKPPPSLKKRIRMESVASVRKAVKEARDAGKTEEEIRSIRTTAIDVARQRLHIPYKNARVGPSRPLGKNEVTHIKFKMLKLLEEGAPPEDVTDIIELLLSVVIPRQVLLDSGLTRQLELAQKAHRENKELVKQTKKLLEEFQTVIDRGEEADAFEVDNLAGLNKSSVEPEALPSHSIAATSVSTRSPAASPDQSKRARTGKFSIAQLKKLEKYFKKDDTPSKKKLEKLSEKLSAMATEEGGKTLDYKQLRGWFYKRRSSNQPPHALLVAGSKQQEGSSVVGDEVMSSTSSSSSETESDSNESVASSVDSRQSLAESNSGTSLKRKAITDAQLPSPKKRSRVEVSGRDAKTSLQSKTFNVKQLSTLIECYERNPSPNSTRMDELVHILNHDDHSDGQNGNTITKQQIQAWFGRRRAKEKKDIIKLQSNEAPVRKASTESSDSSETDDENSQTQVNPSARKELFLNENETSNVSVAPGGDPNGKGIRFADRDELEDNDDDDSSDEEQEEINIEIDDGDDDDDDDEDDDEDVADDLKTNMNARYRRLAPQARIDESLFGKSKKTVLLAGRDIVECQPGERTDNQKSVKATKGNHNCVIMSDQELARLKHESTIISVQDVQAAEAQREQEQEQKVSASKQKKERMIMLGQEAARRAPKTEYEQLMEQERKETLQRAQVLKDHSHDTIKLLKTLGARAQAFTIRDQQRLVKDDLEEESRRYEEKMNTLMELERLQGIQREEELHAEQRAKRTGDRLVLEEQIEQRRQQRDKLNVRTQQEGHDLVAQMKRQQQEQREKDLSRRQHASETLHEIQKFNAQSKQHKMELKRKQQEEDDKIQRYQREKDEEAKEREIQEAIKRQETEIRVARLRANQEKMANEKSEMDELRAKRAAEARERQAREVELNLARKTRDDLAELQKAREIQALHLQGARVQEAMLQQQEYQSIMTQVEADKARVKRENEETRISRIEHRRALQQQIEEKDRLHKKAFQIKQSEGQILKDEYAKELAKLERLRLEQVEQLENAGVNPLAEGQAVSPTNVDKGATLQQADLHACSVGSGAIMTPMDDETEPSSFPALQSAKLTSLRSLEDDSSRSSTASEMLSLNCEEGDQSDDKSKSLSAKFSSQDVEDLSRTLGVDVSFGLSRSDVTERQQRYGSNQLESEEEEPIYKKFLGQFNDPLILLLMASGAVSIIMGHLDDAISIGVAITIVVTVAFVQEYRSEKTLEALKELVPPRCKVLRDGASCETFAKELVPGDIILINVGDRVPADARLLEAVDLEVDESNLTGETLPVCKHTKRIENAETHPIAERKNIVYMGTLIRAGRGRAVVYGIGHKTEFGLVFDAMHSVEDRKTPLQLSMDQLGKHLSMFSLGIISVICLIGTVQGKGLLTMLQIGVSLAVAAIPEGLPICVTVTLAFGVMKMAKQNAIVKKLPAVEALGCISVICVDKTGTITTNQMEVAEIFVPFESVCARVTGIGESAVKNKRNESNGKVQVCDDYLGSHGRVLFREEAVTERTHPHIYNCLLVGALCNNSNITNGKVIGQATEGAVLMCALKIGISESIIKQHNRISEVPFSSEKKWMAVCCDYNGSRRWYMKGMIEAILSRCDKIEDNCGRWKQMTSSDRERIHNEACAMASKGARVLAFSYGESSDHAMVFAGFVGIVDPPRAEVAKSIAQLENSGVKTIMLTGDSKETATAIATQVGILRSYENEDEESAKLGVMSKTGSDLILSGDQLEAMDMMELEHCILRTCVFYRTSPHHKLKIVRAFQEAGIQVAMTGDGVNDAPALKAADIGVAMGRSGTDVSKEASDVILLNDNFHTILYAMEEGKSIYHNIRHFLRFQLSTSIAALCLIAITTLFNLPSPLNAMQILWINIIMDGPPAQSLGVEPMDPDVMKEGPRLHDAHIITKSMIRRILTSAIIIVAGTIYVFYKELTVDGIVSKRDRTMSFTTFVLFDMFNALACRSDTKSILEIGITSNTAFVYAVGFSLLGQLLVIYFAPLQAIFQTESLSLIDLVYVFCIASSVLLSFIFKDLMSGVFGYQGFESFAAQACVTAKPGHQISRGGQKYSEMGVAIMSLPSNNRLGKHNYESVATRDYTSTRGLSSPHNNARRQDPPDHKPFLARTIHQTDYGNIMAEYGCYTNICLDLWKDIFESVTESSGRLSIKGGGLLRLVKEGLASLPLHSEASLVAHSSLARHITELYEDFFTRHPNPIQRNKITWEAFTDATRHINEFLRHNNKQQTFKREGEGSLQTTLRSIASPSSYQVDYGTYGENPCKRPYMRRRGMDATTNDLNSGTMKSTYHIPGYGGFIPHGARNHTATTHAEAEKPRLAVESLRLCCKENLPGYSGHEPTDCTNYRGVSLAGTEQSTTNGQETASSKHCLMNPSLIFDVAACVGTNDPSMALATIKSMVVSGAHISSDLFYEEMIEKMQSGGSFAFEHAVSLQNLLLLCYEKTVKSLGRNFTIPHQWDRVILILEALCEKPIDELWRRNLLVIQFYVSCLWEDYLHHKSLISQNISNHAPRILALLQDSTYTIDREMEWRPPECYQGEATSSCDTNVVLWTAGLIVKLWIRVHDTKGSAELFELEKEEACYSVVRLLEMMYSCTNEIENMTHCLQRWAEKLQPATRLTLIHSIQSPHLKRGLATALIGLSANARHTNIRWLECNAVGRMHHNQDSDGGMSDTTTLMDRPNNADDTAVSLSTRG
uniref:P-type Ca(2+) transporter n=1 Tax=Albugo laibachii Nc14 TaxID=890382 RepID=F0WWU9_9STRA|nr:putative Ptype ATPase [Albugo laibachii Nc14]|eukprot:CCA25931.1 putative Ptype ATPase [Albugo laibachii Nc14]